MGRGDLFLIAIFLLLWGLGAPATALPPWDSSGATTFAQDATGTVWALPTDNYGGWPLRRWQAGPSGTQKERQHWAWADHPLPGTTGFQPWVVTRGDDGSVYVFWQWQMQTAKPSGLPWCLITVHRGVASRILARLADPVMQPQGIGLPTLAADTAGDVWLAGNGPLLWHITPDGGVTPFPLTPNQYFHGNLPDNFALQTLFSLSDGSGRRWFWQSSIVPNWQPNGLRGVLIWDGKSLAYHPTISGIPDHPFSVLAPLDATHFWLATGDYFDNSHPPAHGGLYRVDTRTLTAFRETLPPGGLQNIVQIFKANGEWYAVDNPLDGRTASLWRDERGHWRKRIDKLETSGGYAGWNLRHPWLAEPFGTWFGAGGGAWWLPRGDKPPLWVDWRRGLPALQINGLFPLTDGSALAVSLQGEARIAATPQPIQPLPTGLADGGMGAPKYLGSLLFDARRHLWGTLMSYHGSTPLEEWDGRHWRTHVPPASVDGAGGLYACDTLGRIWLTTSVWHPPAMPQPIEGRAVYDPARDTWTDYATVADALRAAAALPGMAFLPYRNNYQQPPTFSGDGRVLYTDGTKVYLYDGHVWQHWEARDIQPGYPYGNLDSPPHFNARGRLEIALANSGPKLSVWEWTLEAGWQRTGERSPVMSVDPIPPNGPRGLYGSPVVDGEDVKWFVWHDSVYTARAGLWARQTELSAPGSPFRYGFTLENVLRDPFGRLFFVTRPANAYDLVVWSPPPVPKMTLTVIPTADDAVTVRFRSPLRGPHWFLWRLNGDAWSKPQAENTVTLTSLPHGDYRMEVQALDRRLQSSTPAVAVFSIRVATEQQIAHWVQTLLSGTGDQREAAVAGLIKQPDAALPALRAAQVGASESGRWWLDAAIQEIMEQNRAAGNVGQ